MLKDAFICIPIKDLPAELLEELGKLIPRGGERSVSEPDGVSDKLPTTDIDFVKLSEDQAREFIRGGSKEARLTIDAITKGRRRYFMASDVAEALEVEYEVLRYRWQALTRRTRTITDNKSSYLIYWDEKGVYDDNEEEIDWCGWLTPETRDAFRKVLDKK